MRALSLGQRWALRPAARRKYIPVGSLRPSMASEGTPNVTPISPLHRYTSNSMDFHRASYSTADADADADADAENHPRSRTAHTGWTTP